jgi:hypothetical protein
VNINQKLSVMGLLCALVVTGCGGGGGSDDTSDQTQLPPSTPQATAEGFWNGTASNGANVGLTVLENGQTYGYYTTSAGYIVGGVYGNATSSGNQLSGSMQDFNLSTHTVQSGTFTGSFVAKSSLNMQFSAGGTLSANYDPSYDQPPPSLPTIAGTYIGSAAIWNTATQTIPVVISPSGTITQSTINGCGTSGTIQPRASGKNVFDVTLSFQGSNCALGNGATVQGVAVYFPSNSGLIVMSANATKTNGFIYSATK